MSLSFRLHATTAYIAAFSYTGASMMVDCLWETRMKCAYWRMQTSGLRWNGIVWIQVTARLALMGLLLGSRNSHRGHALVILVSSGEAIASGAWSYLAALAWDWRESLVLSATHGLFCDLVLKACLVEAGDVQ
jgi:hypothetical protein